MFCLPHWLHWMTTGFGQLSASQDRKWPCTTFVISFLLILTVMSLSWNFPRYNKTLLKHHKFCLLKCISYLFWEWCHLIEFHQVHWRKKQQFVQRSVIDRRKNKYSSLSIKSIPCLYTVLCSKINSNILFIKLLCLHTRPHTKIANCGLLSLVLQWYF